MNISASSLDSLSKYLKIHSDTLKSQTTSMKDGKPNPSHVEMQGREKIEDRLKSDEKKISKLGENISSLKTLDSRFKSIDTSLGNFASVSTKKDITSPHGLQGVVAAGAAYETKHVTVNKKASNCVWTITPRDGYKPSSWASESDIAVSDTGADPKVFDISANPGGPHLRITNTDGNNLDVTLTNGMSLEDVVDVINVAIEGDVDFNGKLEAVVTGPAGYKEIVIKSNEVGNGNKFSITPLVDDLASHITMSPNPENIIRASFLKTNGQPWDIFTEPPVLSQFNGIDVPNVASGPIILNGHEMVPAFGWDPATASIDNILDEVVNFFNDETINTGVRAEKVEDGLFRHIEFISIDGRGIDFRNKDSDLPFAPMHAFQYQTDALDFGAQITVEGTKFYSDDDAFQLPNGSELNVSGVIMPVSGDALATTYSIVPKANWSGIVSDLVESYNLAADLIDSVEMELDENGIHTSPLYASREMLDLSTLIRNIKNKSIMLGGEKVAWQNFGISFTGSKMTLNKAVLDEVQNSPAEAAKISAFLQGMSNNELSVRTAGAFGRIEAQVSDAKIGGYLSVTDGLNTYANQLTGLSVHYNGGDRMDESSYTVAILLPDGTQLLEDPVNTFSFSVSDLGDNKSIRITGAGPYAGLSLDYLCPADEDYQAGDGEFFGFTYVAPNSPNNIKTKVTLLSESEDVSKMSLITDISFTNRAGVNLSAVFYGGSAPPFDIVTLNGDGTATLTMTNGDLKGLSLKVSTSIGNLVPDQTYVFKNIVVAPGIGNFAGKAKDISTRINNRITTLSKNSKQSQDRLNAKKARMESLLEQKVNAARIAAMMIEIQQTKTKAILNMLNPKSQD